MCGAAATRLRNALRVGPDLTAVSGEQVKANYVMQNYNQVILTCHPRHCGVPYKSPRLLDALLPSAVSRLAHAISTFLHRLVKL